MLMFELVVDAAGEVSESCAESAELEERERERVVSLSIGVRGSSWSCSCSCSCSLSWSFWVGKKGCVEERPSPGGEGICRGIDGAVDAVVIAAGAVVVEGDVGGGDVVDAVDESVVDACAMSLEVVSLSLSCVPVRPSDFPSPISNSSPSYPILRIFVSSIPQILQSSNPQYPPKATNVPVKY